MNPLNFTRKNFTFKPYRPIKILVVLLLIGSFSLSESNAQMPTCATTINTFPYSESFESGLGNWNQSAVDSVDWIRNSFGTQSIGTGPSSGSAGSTYYMYTEGSFSLTGDEAWLDSDCFDFTGVIAPTIDFDYHMFGAAMGSVELLISTNGVVWTSLWFMSGDQGDVWNTVSINLSAYAGQTVAFRFLGTSGTTFSSDAAIDNIHIYNNVPMSYVSSNVTQNNTSDVSQCSNDAVIIGIEVTTSGALTPLLMDQFRLRTDGTTNPSGDVNLINVYYTGNSSTFARTNLYASAAPANAGSNILFNGNQVLEDGVNYFWVVYDLVGGSTVGNNLDALCNRIRVDGRNQFPSTTNPVGERTINICEVSPGGIGSADLKAWYKADNGTGVTATGSRVSQWNDNSPLLANITQTINTRRPTYNAGNMNYNPSILFDGSDDYLTAELGANSYTSDFTMFTEVELHSTNPEGAFFHNHFTSIGNSDLTSFQLDSDGTSYRYRNISAVLWGVANLRTKLLSVKNKNVGFNTEVEVFDLGLSGGITSFSGLDRGHTFSHYELGSSRVRTRYSNNSTAEVIIFSTDLLPIDQTKVESYLAIKYGETLDNSMGGIEGDYISPLSLTLWDADDNASYHNDIIGIAKEDVEGLLQKQSHSFDDTTRIYLSTLASTNLGNTGTFTNDASYLLMGHNGGAMCDNWGAHTETPSACNLLSRLEREWKVTNTNMANSFNMDMTLGPCPAFSAISAANLRLLVDDDGDFSNGGTTCYFNGDGSGVVLTYSNSVVTISNIQNTQIPMNSTRFITLASVDILLPVDLQSFTGTCDNGSVSLEWSTVSEINNDYFEIEKSVNAIEFSTIAQVRGNGTAIGGHNYKYIDKNPTTGMNYYRIKETDKEGKVSYSNTISTSCEVLDGIVVFPNPFEESFIVNLWPEIENPINLTIHDCTGKVVYQEVYENQFGQIELMVGNKLVSGVYVLKIDIEGVRYVRKLIKK
jgi:hypothetical protein